MTRKKDSKDYPLSTKLEAIRLAEQEGLSNREITERLAIRDPKRVQAWLRTYRQECKAGLKKAATAFPSILMNKKGRFHISSIQCKMKSCVEPFHVPFPNFAVVR